MSVDESGIINGGIYKVRDSEIDFPDTPLTRTKHPYRTVVVLSSDEFCQSGESIVSVAPLSGEFSTIHPTDEIVYPGVENKLRQKSRVLLGHIQTIRKQALLQKFGRISDADWQRIMAKIVENFDR